MLGGLSLKGSIIEFRNIRANYSTHHSRCGTPNLEPFRSPELLTIEVIDHLVRSIPEILAVEWHAHDEETHAEHWLSLSEFDLALVRTS